MFNLWFSRSIPYYSLIVIVKIVQSRVILLSLYNFHRVKSIIIRKHQEFIFKWTWQRFYWILIIVIKLLPSTTIFIQMRPSIAIITTNLHILWDQFIDLSFLACMIKNRSIFFAFVLGLVFLFTEEEASHLDGLADGQVRCGLVVEKPKDFVVQVNRSASQLDRVNDVVLLHRQLRNILNKQLKLLLFPTQNANFVISSAGESWKLAS